MLNYEHLTLNPLARFMGEDEPAGRVLQQAFEKGHLPISPLADLSLNLEDDSTLIDPDLRVEPMQKMQEPPRAGLSYAGYTPNQRAAYLNWLDDAQRPAPLVFQQQYIANLEAKLFEGKRELMRAQRELIRLDATPAWQQNEALDRAILLSFWLQQDGESLVRWLVSIETTPAAFSLALGHMAIWKRRLTEAPLHRLLQAWGLLPPVLDTSLLHLRFDFLATTLGEEPLVYALRQLGEAAQAPQPWRTVHRNLRFGLPHPQIRSILEPLIAEIVSVNEQPSDLSDKNQTSNALPDEADSKTTHQSELDFFEELENPRQDWQLILEFEENRSQYLEFALEVAQKQEGYSALLDENRRLVHRVRFNKGKLRPFWRLWEWVGSWPNTHVYRNGKELSRSQIWPGSPAVR